MLLPSEPSKNRVWIVPLNDLEALEIRNLLQSQHETVLHSNQRWGATWEKLETGVVHALRNFRQKTPEGEIIGVELAGPNSFGAINIDHHKYTGDDRSSPYSSLEQVAGRLGIELTNWQRLVAANDRGYIPAMLSAGASADEVSRVRALDRAAQGLTDDDEQAAVEDIRLHSDLRGSKILVRCSGNPTSAHSDRLFEIAREILLAGPSEWSYSGQRHLLLAGMGFPEPHWSGGNSASGYFGIASPSVATQNRILNAFWERVADSASAPAPPPGLGS